MLPEVTKIPVEVALQNPDVLSMARHFKKAYGKKACKRYLEIVCRVESPWGAGAYRERRLSLQEVCLHLTDEWLPVSLITDKVYGPDRDRKAMRVCSNHLRKAVRKGLAEVQKIRNQPYYRRMGAEKRVETPKSSPSPPPLRVYYDPSLISR